MTIEQVITAFLKGKKVVDNMNGEPGRCSNGGNYYEYYRLKNGRVLTWDSSDWSNGAEDSGFTVDSFVSFLRSTANDTCNYVAGERWSVEL